MISLMQDFYQLPRGIVKALIQDQKLEGTVFVPLDRQETLSKQFKDEGFEVDSNEDPEALYREDFWIKAPDYVICATVGDAQLADSVCNLGLIIAKKAVIILDRITFLEPVRKRREFLEASKCSNMIVLNPRPQYRVMGTTKDSVTSCWFTFRRKEHWADGTHISYAVDWEACKPELSVEKIRRLQPKVAGADDGAKQKAG